MRLEDYGFADRHDGLHVDQKWINLVPSLFNDRVHVARNAEYNVAFWNLHERSVDVKGDSYYIGEQPLVFFHFASQLALREYAADSKSAYSELFGAYEAHLAHNGHKECTTYPYRYSHYDNGISIFAFQRRLYRKLLEKQAIATDPFSTGSHSFYALLDANGLIIEEKSATAYSRKDLSGSGRLIRWYERALILLKGLVGTKYYHLFIRLMRNTSRPEDQLFQIRKGLSKLR